MKFSFTFNYSACRLPCVHMRICGVSLNCLKFGHFYYCLICLLKNRKIHFWGIFSVFDIFQLDYFIKTTVMRYQNQIGICWKIKKLKVLVTHSAIIRLWPQFSTKGALHYFPRKWDQIFSPYKILYYLKHLSKFMQKLCLL